MEHSPRGSRLLNKFPDASVIPGFRREVDENCALLGHYAASSSNFLPTFRDNLSVPSSGVKNKKERRLLSPALHCRSHTNTALHILNQMNPMNTIRPISYCHIYFSITITPICPTSFPLRFGTKVCKFIPLSHLSHPCYIPSPSSMV